MSHLLSDYLPGYKEAHKLEYTLHSYSSNKRYATYVKDHKLFLDIFYDQYDKTKLRATLNACHKMVKLEIGPISFPHKSIKMFENQILELL